MSRLSVALSAIRVHHGEIFSRGVDEHAFMVVAGYRLNVGALKLFHKPYELNDVGRI